MTAYADFYRQSIDHRDAFWSEQAKLAYASSISPSVLDFKGQGRTFALTYTLAY